MVPIPGPSVQEDSLRMLKNLLKLPRPYSIEVTGIDVCTSLETVSARIPDQIIT